MTVTVSPPTSSRSPQPAPAPRLPGVTLPSVATGVAVLLASLSLSPVYDSGDGVHPNDAGHAVIAGRVVSLIDSRRCVGTSR